MKLWRLALLLAASLAAAPPLPARAAFYSYQALGCAQLTSLSSATSLSSVPGGIPTGAGLAALTIEGQTVRMRDDGTAPTASVGLLLPVGGPWPYQGALAKVQFIQSGGPATIDVCFYQ